MKDLAFLWGILWLLVLGISTSYSQEEAAQRAAHADAMRQLSGTIQELRISSHLRVKDFLAESEEVAAAFDKFLNELQQVGTPVYREGTWEVTLVVTIEQIIGWLKETRKRYPSRVISSPGQFDHIRYYTSEKVFYATGTAVEDPSLPPGENVWEWVTPRGMELAELDAEVDAYCKIGETIKGLRISPHATVKDFVASGDEIRTAFDKFVQEAEFVGQPRYKPEGIVELTVEVEVDKLITSLSEICRSYSRGSRWKPSDFANIRTYYSHRIIRATGSGVPPDKYIKSPDTFPPLPSPSKLCKPEWANRIERVTGTGVPPENAANHAQAKLMARRAAVLDAYRLLTERVMGLKLDARTSVQDFVTQHDVIQGKVAAFIQGGQIVATRYLPDGIVEVDMEIYLGDIWEMIQEHDQR